MKKQELTITLQCHNCKAQKQIIRLATPTNEIFPTCEKCKSTWPMEAYAVELKK